jgi:transcriptional regulator with XRE-family HTH domain
VKRKPKKRKPVTPRVLRPVHRNIRAFRTRLDMSQSELGARCGVDKSNVSHWELGACSPSNKRLYLVADALGTTVAELIS